jgi:hypothetical protein
MEIAGEVAIEAVAVAEHPETFRQAVAKDLKLRPRFLNATPPSQLRGLFPSPMENHKHRKKDRFAGFVPNQSNITPSQNVTIAHAMYVLCDFEHCMKKWIVLFAR